MTHVAHPYVQRIGVNRDWKSRWFTTDAKNSVNIFVLMLLSEKCLKKAQRNVCRYCRD